MSTNKSNDKKKLEDKTVKSLKELASIPNNKQCCDCNQKGPTYINITIGTFVCTACSGILRGLNPPHRVKSINMATFTVDEIDFLKARGNHYCKLVFMSLFDSITGIQPDSRDTEKLRDFLTQKYERKRWYCAPNDSIINQIKYENESIAYQLSLNNSTNNTHKLKLSSNTNNNTTTQIVINPQQKQNVHLNNTNILNNNNNVKQASPSSNSNDIFASFDAFTSSSTTISSSVPVVQPTTQTNNNFANFDLFTNDNQIQQSNSFSSLPQHHNTSQLNNNDKYAVFAELDSIFQSPESTITTTTVSNTVSQPVVFNQQQSTNPFLSIQPLKQNISYVSQQQNYFSNNIQQPTAQPASLQPFNYFANSTPLMTNMFTQQPSMVTNNMISSLPTQQISMNNNVNPFISIAKQQSQIQKPKSNSTNPFL